MENSKMDFDEKDLELLELLKGYVGTYVKIDMSKCPNYYEKRLAKGQRYFYTNIVGLQKFNCGNDGFSDNKAHLTGYPDASGRNWCGIDVNSICGIVDDPLFTLSLPPQQLEQTKDQLYRGLEYLLTDHEIDEDKIPNLLARYKAYIDVIMEGKKIVE